MIRFLLLLGFGFLCIIIQSNTFLNYYVFPIKPDLTIPLTLYVSLYMPPAQGGLLVAGVAYLMDAASGGTLGLYIFHDRLVRAWWRAARLSPGGVDGRQHQRLFGTPAAAGWMVCEPFRHQRTGLSQSATLAASPGLGTGLTSAQPLRAGRRASIIAEYATDSRLSRLVQPSDLPGGRKSRPLHHRQLATSQPTRPPPPPHWPLRGYGPSCAARPLLAHCPQLATHLPRTTRRTHPR